MFGWGGDPYDLVNILYLKFLCLRHNLFTKLRSEMTFFFHCLGVHGFIFYFISDGGSFHCSLTGPILLLVTTEYLALQGCPCCKNDLISNLACLHIASVKHQMFYLESRHFNFLLLLLIFTRELDNLFS